MPRPPRCRRICGAPQVDTFCPNGCENTEPILLTLDEYEVIRLVDLEQQTHEQCAAQMDISRSTVQEIYESARRKIAACLVHGKPLHITGGNYRICGGQEAAHCGRCCRMQRANTEKSKPMPETLPRRFLCQPHRAAFLCFPFDGMSIPLPPKKRHRQKSLP